MRSLVRQLLISAYELNNFRHFGASSRSITAYELKYVKLIKTVYFTDTFRVKFWNQSIKDTSVSFIGIWGGHIRFSLQFINIVHFRRSNIGRNIWSECGRLWDLKSKRTILDTSGRKLVSWPDTTLTESVRFSITANFMTSVEITEITPSNQVWFVWWSY